MRSLSRECVFKFLYAELFNPCDEEFFAVLKREAKLNEDDCNFADLLLEKVEENKEKYLKFIEEVSYGFKLNRIFNADKCAIILGMAELDNFKETPIPVVIDEAVKLAGKFSTEKSTDFVNGILARYREELNG